MYYNNNPTIGHRDPSLSFIGSTSLEKLSKNKYHKMPSKHKELSDEYKCIITQKIMSDPCIAADGFTYERVALEQVTFVPHPYLE